MCMIMKGIIFLRLNLKKSTAKAISVSNDKLVVLFQSFNLPSKAGKKSNNDNPSIVVYNIINNKDVALTYSKQTRRKK